MDIFFQIPSVKMKEKRRETRIHFLVKVFVEVVDARNGDLSGENYNTDQSGLSDLIFPDYTRGKKD